jgi:hypothetical protein
MIEDAAGRLGWLGWRGVPLWAFILALLTRPTTWARAARDRVATALPGGGSDD